MLEPLESLTSAALIFELRQLLMHFPGDEPNDSLRFAYNESVRGLHESNVDFLSLIYFLAAPETAGFWREATLPSRLSDRAARMLRFFRERAPLSVAEIYDDKALLGLFTAAGIIPRQELPLASFLPLDEGRAALAEVQQRNQTIRERCLSHSEYLSAIVARTGDTQ
jgi:tryptophan halogenase